MPPLYPLPVTGPARSCPYSGTDGRKVRGPGIRIAPGERDAVFDRFYRGPRTQAVPGSGLGLAIVHDLVTAGGGAVFATAAPGGGAEVGFRMPPHGRAARLPAG
ncbi:sensor histidine kinase [Streptomyces sp. NPDC029003]|uniref:sensor histidine kinase n=1 Tax=Streptomyces sp. NPDC029003 TaxID=3155125 RepID=UPI0033DF29EE